MWDAKRWTLLCLSVSVAVVNTTFSLLAPIFPEVAASKGVGATMVGFIFSGYSIVTVVASPIIGQLLTMRILSRARCLLGGILLVGIASGAFGLVSAIDDTDTFLAVCIGLRLVLGLGCAMVDTASTAAVAVLYGDDDQLGAAMGLLEACLGIGWVVGPAVGGVLADWGGFGLPFYIAAGATLAIGPIPIFISGKRIDANVRSGRKGQETLTVWSVVSVPAIQIMLLSALLGAAAVTWIEPTLQPHLQGLGFSVSFVGSAFAVLSFLYALMAPVVGWLSDSHGQGPMMITGCLVTALSYLLLCPIPALHLPVSSVPLILGSLAIMGMGSCMVFVPALSAMMAVSLERFGKVEGLEDIVSGLLNSSYYLGGGIAPMIGGAVTESVGFAWSSTYFAVAMLAHCATMALSIQAWPILAGRAASTPGRADSMPDKAPLLPTPVKVLQPRVGGVYDDGDTIPVMRGHLDAAHLNIPVGATGTSALQGKRGKMTEGKELVR